MISTPTKLTVDLLVNLIGVTERRHAIIAAFSAATRINATNTPTNHGTTANLGSWVVDLFPTQGNDLASMAEVFLCIVAPTYTACTMAATDFGYHVLSTAKVPRGIITR